MNLRDPPGVIPHGDSDFRHEADDAERRQERSGGVTSTESLEDDTNQHNSNFPTISNEMHETRRSEFV